MSAGYEELLDATIRHLEHLRARGQRLIPVSSEVWRDLLTPPQPATPTKSRPPAPATRPTISSGAPPATAPRALTTTVPLVAMPKVRVPDFSRKPTESSPAPGGVPTFGFQSNDPAKIAAFTALQQRVLACVQCPNLVAARHTVVFGVGHLDARLMFVGEAPGADEDLQGEPFVGKAGQLLTKIIEAMALQRSEVFIANILKCRPDTPGQAAGNRKPTPAEMATCIPYLQEQIDLIKPQVLVALGATAVEGLLGKTVGITKLRGTWQTYRGIPLMPTYHPAYLLRNQSLAEKRKVWEDMLQVLERLAVPITAKQRGFFSKGQ